MQTLSFTSPAGKVGTTYEHSINLTGTGPFSLGEWFLPDGWTASIVGTSLSFSGMATEVETGFRASFEIFSCCDCDPVTLTTTIAIAAGCTYSWSMYPTIAPVGTSIKTTFTPPKGCPADTVLHLAVFGADGVTPYHPPWRPSGALILSISPGSSQYVTTVDDAGQDLIFKPHSEQAACIQNCTPSNVSQGRIVPALDPCTITFDVQPRNFTADNPDSKTTYTALGPAGCSVKILLFVGNTPYLIDGVQANFTIPVGEPVTFSTPWPASAIGSDFNWRPAPTEQQPSCAQRCTVQPTRLDFDVGASSCVIQWDLYPSPVAVGATSALRVLSGPPNCTISFQAYNADGVTPISGAVINIATDANGVGSSSEGVCTGPGTAVWKPVSPQTSACALACSFGRSSFTHICTSTSTEEPPGTCGLTLTTTCIPTETFKLNGTYTTSFSAAIEAYNASTSTWVFIGGRIITALPHTWTPADLGIVSISSIYSKLRMRNQSVPSCVTNELPRACGVGVPPPPPPPAPPPPPPGTCIAGLSVDGFSPAPTCGTPVSPTAVPGVAWSVTFNIAPGTTASLVGAPSGMTGTTVGSQYIVNWPTPVAGTYSFSVVGAQAGCTNCTFPFTMVVAATSACARLAGYISQGPSAYSPASATSFNAADQNRTLTVTGTPGQTFQLVSTGSYVSSSGTLTIPPGGVWTQLVPVGQAVAGWSTTWTLSAAGGTPVTVCSGYSTVTITGDTTLKLSLAATAPPGGGTQWAVQVTGPVGTSDVPFVLSFGSSSPGGMGGSSVCADNNFGVVNTALHTNYGGVGGNTFSFASGAIAGPYAIAVKLTTLSGESSLTHQVVDDSNVVVAGMCKSVSWA